MIVPEREYIENMRKEFGLASEQASTLAIAYWLQMIHRELVAIKKQCDPDDVTVVQQKCECGGQCHGHKD